METRTRETEVTPEVNDIGEAFKELCVQYKEAKKDGWQPGKDIPQILLGSMNKLMVAFDGADKSTEEAKLEPFKAGLGAIIPIVEGIDLLRAKKPPME